MTGGGRDRSGSDRGQLVEFRARLRSCLHPWGDALFELADAIICRPGPISSLPQLSLEPVFTRSHGSLYKALARGRVDEDRLRRLLADVRPKGWPLVFGVDASTWPRCDAECSPERGYHYSASRHSAGKPIVAGWSYQWVSQLGFSSDSWTAPLDIERISPRHDATEVTIEQVRRVVATLDADKTPIEGGEAPLFVFDAGYDASALTEGLADLSCQVLVRIAESRVFYRDPTSSPGARGRPPRHGTRFALAEASTWEGPDSQLARHDPRYGEVSVSAWSGLHQKLHGRGRRQGAKELPIVRGSVIRVEVEHLPKPTARAKKTLWLWWTGPDEPDLELCFRAYLRRFDLEHAYRFAKGTLGWTTPELCTPAQADRWTWLVVAAYTELRLARDLVDDLRLPWERPAEPGKLTPYRVRRAFRLLRAAIGTPALPPKIQVPGPGRPKGTRRGRRTRYPAIKKGP